MNCPKCGAEVKREFGQEIIFECSGRTVEGYFDESCQCLRNQLNQSKEEIERLKSEIEELKGDLRNAI